MFEGTLRSNLDPFGEYSDDDALRAVHLHDFVAATEAKLEYQITESTRFNCSIPCERQASPFCERDLEKRNQIQKSTFVFLFSDRLFVSRVVTDRP